MPCGWLFHLDCRNVLATHWEPLFRSPHTPCADVVGFRVRLLETDGDGVRLGLRCFRDVASARRIAPKDEKPTELTAKGDRIDVPIGPHQWIDLEARFG